MTVSNPPKATVFIPVYNREVYVGAAIDSILAQSFPDFELLLIDDGSTDRSLEVMRSYADPRIRIVRNESNLGIPRTRNKGLELARGEYIAMLDSDDLAHPQRLEKQSAFLDRHPDYAEIGSWGRAIDGQGRRLRKVKRQPVSSEDTHAQLLFYCCLNNRSVMARTAILREYGYRNDYPRCQDYELHVRLSKKYKLGNLPEYLVYGRIHPGQITRNTLDLGEAKKREIVRGQLDDLGVAFSESDVVAHQLLSRLHKRRFTPDRAYLEWAEAWLMKLKEANRKTQCYSEPALARAVNEKWAGACRAAWSGMGWTAWKCFVRSPLREGLRLRLRRGLKSVPPVS